MERTDGHVSPTKLTKEHPVDGHLQRLIRGGLLPLGLFPDQPFLFLLPQFLEAVGHPLGLIVFGQQVQIFRLQWLLESQPNERGHPFVEEAGVGGGVEVSGGRAGSERWEWGMRAGAWMEMRQCDQSRVRKISGGIDRKSARTEKRSWPELLDMVSVSLAPWVEEGMLATLAAYF